MVEVVVVDVVVVVVGAVHALSQAVNLASYSLTVIPKVVLNAATWSPTLPASAK